MLYIVFIASAVVCLWQTKLEQKLNEAIALGEFDAAEAISERLAARDVSIHLALMFVILRVCDRFVLRCSYVLEIRNCLVSTIIQQYCLLLALVLHSLVRKCPRLLTPEDSQRNGRYELVVIRY